jgi:two-component system, NarL family, nitrate/nitrite response regulator NarL
VPPGRPRVNREPAIALQSRPCLAKGRPHLCNVDLVLVEDHAAYRESFRIALSRLTTHKIVGEAGSAREGRAVIEQRRPDLAIVDFILGDSDGVSLARDLKRRRVRTPILMLCRVNHPLFIRDALAVGVRGYVLKHESLGDVIRAIERVGAGEVFISPHIQAQLQAPPDSPGLERLSRREREILCLLIEGRASKEIASALCISTRTVDAHRLQINRKLDLRSPAQLARYAADHRLLG